MLPHIHRPGRGLHQQFHRQGGQLLWSWSVFDAVTRAWCVDVIPQLTYLQESGSFRLRLLAGVVVKAIV